MERRLRDKLPAGRFSNVPVSHSKRMAAVRAKENRTTERRFRALLVQAGIKGWKVRPRGLPGSPDFYFSAQSLAVFIDGCYWHGCPRCGHIPRTNRPFWAAKIQRNNERDRTNAVRLRERGLQVLRFWEHELRCGRTAIERLRGALENHTKGAITP
jgi:DNA mismatch endonuclease (patch repair protein)